MNANTRRALKPSIYRDWIEHCAAQGLDPIPAHSVTPNGCWALVTPKKPMASGHMRISRWVDGKRYDMLIHTLSLLHSQAPSVWATLDEMLAQGKRPQACHKPICAGNKACFNPTHLRLDDDAGNTRDRQRDGNQVRGEAVGNAKLTDAQVAAIRAEHDAGATNVALGRKYGVSDATISRIVNRKRRAHSDGKLF